MRRWAPRVGLLLAAVLALVGVWTAVSTPAVTAPEDRARAVAQTLRCPTCAGEDVADSSAPLAEAMRLVVAEQVAEGRSAPEIRSWFAQRYGDQVLLDPPRRGAGWLLWAVPVVLVGGAVVLLARRWVPGHRWVPAATSLLVVGGVLGAWAWSPREPGPVAAEQAGQVSAIPVLEQAVARSPGQAELRLALAGNLEQADRPAEAVEHYEAVTRLRPLDADVRYRYAFALLRSGQEQAATTVLEDTLDLEPDHAASALLLGTLLHQSGDGRSETLLRRFLELAPEHPAAQEVRGWLGEPAAEPAASGGGA